MFRQRSPNLPPTTQSALSPRFIVLTTAASMASVPEPVSISTGCLVWNSQRSPSAASVKMRAKSAVRWWTMGRAIASITRSGTGVGPGVSRYCLIAMATL